VRVDAAGAQARGERFPARGAADQHHAFAQRKPARREAAERIDEIGLVLVELDDVIAARRALQ
jgi:hypothetical protein